MAEKNWPALAQMLGTGIKDLHKAMPELMKSFRAMDETLMGMSALDKKTKELIALSAGIAARCDGCIAFHASAAAKYGATRDEVMETIGVAIVMGGGPSVIYGARAVEAFDQFSGLAQAAE